MEFTRPGAIPEGIPKPAPEPEVKPIELDEPAAGEGDEAIQVGTLAELAQMDGAGGTVKPDVAEDAIEIDDKPAPVPAPAAEPVKREAAAAGAEIAAKVDGLTPEQAEAIQRLTADVIERVVWEVVPDLAETLIREQIDKLLEE
jgi:hypothetical protein